MLDMKTINKSSKKFSGKPQNTGKHRESRLSRSEDKVEEQVHSVKSTNTFFCFKCMNGKYKDLWDTIKYQIFELETQKKNC